MREDVTTDAVRDSNPTSVEGDHRVSNSLSITCALLRMQRHRSVDHAVKTALLSVETRINSIAKFHEYIHRNESYQRIDLADYLREVLREIDSGLGIRCTLVVDPACALEVPGRVARNLTLIVNELALNTIKHAYDGREGGSMTVELDRDAEGRLRLRIADGGAGLPTDFDAENGSGLGMKIVSSLVCEMGGSLSSHTNSGAHFTVTIRGY